MMNTNWREAVWALAGAIIGFALPILLHALAARLGDAEIFGIPLIVLSLPGFFVGAVFGARLSRGL